MNNKTGTLDRNSIRDRLNRLILDANMDRKTFAAKSGIQYTHLSGVMKKNSNKFFTLEQLALIRREFKLTWDNLMEGTSDSSYRKSQPQTSSVANEPSASLISSFKEQITHLNELLKAKDMIIQTQQDLISSLKVKR